MLEILRCLNLIWIYFNAILSNDVVHSFDFGSTWHHHLIRLSVMMCIYVVSEIPVYHACVYHMFPRQLSCPRKKLSSLLWLEGLHNIGDLTISSRHKSRESSCVEGSSKSAYGGCKIPTFFSLQDLPISFAAMKSRKVLRFRIGVTYCVSDYKGWWIILETSINNGFNNSLCI